MKSSLLLILKSTMTQNTFTYVQEASHQALLSDHSGHRSPSWTSPLTRCNPHHTLPVRGSAATWPGLDLPYSFSSPVNLTAWIIAFQNVQASVMSVPSGDSSHAMPGSPYRPSCSTSGPLLITVPPASKKLSIKVSQPGESILIFQDSNRKSSQVLGWISYSLQQTVEINSRMPLQCLVCLVFCLCVGNQVY